MNVRPCALLKKYSAIKTRECNFFKKIAVGLLAAEKS